MFYQILSGVIYGFIVVLGMINSIPIESVVFDGRSIVLFIGTYFMGFYSAMVMGIVSLIARVLINGSGVTMGVLIIVEAIILGLIARQIFYEKKETYLKKLGIFLVIFFIHIVMVGVLHYVPGGNKHILRHETYLPVIVIFPLITYLIYELFVYFQEQETISEEVFKVQENFRQFIEYSGNYYVRFDIQGQISYINNQFLELINSDNDLIRQNISTLLYKGNPTISFPKIVERVKKDKKHLLNVEDVYFDQINKPIYIVWNFQGFFDGNEQLIDIMAVGIDVTSVHDLQNALDSSETHLKSIFELAVDAILIGNPEGKIIMANKRALEMTGYSESELMGNHIAILFNGNELEDKPLRFDLLNKGLEVRTERSLLRKDGTSIFIEMNTKRMPKGTYSAIIRDNTDRKHLENELRSSEVRYRTLFDDANDAILLLHDYRIVESNIRASELFGLTKKQFVGKAPWDFSPAFQKGRLQSDMLAKEYIDISLKEGEYFFEWKHIVENEKEIVCEIKLKRIQIGGLDYVQAIIHDNSARKIIADKESLLKLRNEQLIETNLQLEKSKNKAEESDRLKSAFLANMSHEIRTPLNGIIGFCDLLKGKEIDSEKAGFFISVIEKSSKQLLELINDIINLSKIEAKQEVLHMEEFDLDILVQDLFNLYSPMAINQNIGFTLEKKYDKGLWIKSDPVKIKQILGNIINNALKFTKSGGIKINYSVLNEKEIRFEILDSGIGIASEDISKIFERFRQIETEIGKKTEGTGLGLAICKSLVQMLGGKIEVESELGKGSKFIIDLLVEFVNLAENDAVIQKEATKIDKPNLNNKLILVAEDENVNMLLIKSMLVNCDATVIEACNGQEAVDFIISGAKVDLILMDIKMPRLNGIEAASKIAEINPTIPIIALTAYAMHQEMRVILQSGFVDIVTKPIDQTFLYFILNRYLKS